MSTLLVPLSNRGFVAIDEADLPLLKPWTWWQDSEGYARTMRRAGGKHVALRLHTLLAWPPPGMQVDHINGDRLDNRRCNLRVVTRAVNLQNRRRANRNNATGVLNVTLHGGVYRAQLNRNRVRVHFSRHATLEDAAAAIRAARAEYAEATP